MQPPPASSSWPTRPTEARRGKRGSIIRGQPSSKPWACITMGLLATWSKTSRASDFAFLGRLAKKHRLIWGGDWGSRGASHKFVDSVHVQRCAMARQKALFAGTWYPDQDYDPTPDSQGRGTHLPFRRLFLGHVLGERHGRGQRGFSRVLAPLSARARACRHARAALCRNHHRTVRR